MSISKKQFPKMPSDFRVGVEFCALNYSCVLIYTLSQLITDKISFLVYIIFGVDQVSTLGLGFI